MDSLQVVLCSTLSQDKVVTAWDVLTGTCIAQYSGAGPSSSHGLTYSGGYVLTCEQDKPLLHAWALNKHHPEKFRLLGPGKIDTLAFSPESSHIAVAVDGNVHLYQANSGRLLGTGHRHFRKIVVVRFNYDGTLIACGGEDGIITVWRISTLANEKDADPYAMFSEHTLPVKDLRFTSGSLRSRVISVSADSTCKVFDLVSKKCLLSIVSEKRLTAISILTTESEIYLGDCEGKISEVSLLAQKSYEYHLQPPVGFIGHESEITCLDSTVDSIFLISGSTDQTLRIWHISGKQCIRTITTKGPVTDLLFALIPKSAFANNFKPTAMIKDFIRPSENDLEDEIVLEVLIKDNLITPPDSPKIHFDSSSSNDKNFSLKVEINRLKRANNSLYEYCLNNVIKQKIKP